MKCDTIKQFVLSAVIVIITLLGITLSWASTMGKCCDITKSLLKRDFCEAQARVRQGSARDGPQGGRPQSVNPSLKLTLKLVATRHPPTGSLNTLA